MTDETEQIAQNEEGERRKRSRMRRKRKPPLLCIVQEVM